MPSIFTNDYTGLITYDKDTIKKAAYELLPRTHPAANLIRDIPTNLHKYYSTIGDFIHPATKKPVLRLLPHQEEIWNDYWRAKYRCYIKSQKLAVTTLLLTEDSRISMTDALGQEVLVVAQSVPKAEQHLDDLEQIFRSSPQWRPYLLEKQVGDERDDLGHKAKSAVGKLVIRNPEDPRHPGYIYACTITRPSSLVSFKKVRHVHLSDVNLAEISEETFAKAWGGVMSRIANTDGTFVIEGPMRGPTGPVYDIIAPLLRNQKIGEELPEGVRMTGLGDFLVRRYSYRYGIRTGLFTKYFIEKQRQLLGSRFGMFYEGTVFNSDTTWFNPQHVKNTSTEATMIYDS